MKNPKIFIFEFIVCCLVVFDAHAIFISNDYNESNPYTDAIFIDELTLDTEIENHGVITGPITVSNGIGATFINYGLISGNVSCGSCVMVEQSIPDNGAINPVPGLIGHAVVVENGATEIHLADVIAISLDAEEIRLENSGVIVSPEISSVHPKIIIDSTNAMNFIVQGLPTDWDSTVPVLTGIHYGGGVHDVQVIDLDPMYVARGYISGRELYVELERQTDYSVVLDNEMGNLLDELQNENPNDNLIGALDNATTVDEINEILSRSVRTNPIKLMAPLQSLNSFVLGSNLYDMSFGIVAEPFYVYSGEFSVIGGGVGVSGTPVKNLITKVGLYAGKMNYSGDFDDFNGMVYGANLGAMYKDADWYFKTIGTLASARFKDISVFDGENTRANPHGVSGAAVMDGGLVFRIMDDFDVTPFIGVRFDYAKVLHFTDTDTNLRFGLNIDKQAIVDGNRYAFGIQALGQTNGEFYGAIYTDMMSEIDGVGGRLQFGILHDDFGMSYKFSFDAKFVF